MKRLIEAVDIRSCGHLLEEELCYVTKIPFRNEKDNVSMTVNFLRPSLSLNAKCLVQFSGKFGQINI